MNDDVECTCGHIWDEHLHPGDDPEAPNSTACDVPGCECGMFDAA